MGSFKKLLLLLMLIDSLSAFAFSSILDASISEDGNYVALLNHDVKKNNEIWILNTGKPGSQRELTPAFAVTSLKFGLKNNELLFTYRSKKEKFDSLAMWNLNNLDSPPVTIFNAPSLAYPIDLGDGKYMIRSRLDGDRKSYLSGFQWVLVGNGKVQAIEPKFVLPHAYPNIFESGFYWLEEKVFDKYEAYPKILSFPLPNGEAPKIRGNQFPKNTWAISCDRLGLRCLRSYLSNPNQSGDYLYGLDIVMIKDGEQCKVQDSLGVINRVSITANGNAAIASYAQKGSQQGYVLIMNFQPGKCLPIIVRKFDFKGESK